MPSLYYIFALIPFLLIFLLMIGLRRPAFQAMPLVLGVTVALAWLLWGLSPTWFAVALTKGFLVTLDILMIIFGVIFFFTILKKTPAFSGFEKGISSLSRDRRIQAIIVGWFFVALIEGAAGFGTPAMLAAPLLMHLGFPALLAVAIGLIGDSIPVTFGAVGVPITIGLAQGLPPEVASDPALIASVINQTTLIYILIGFLVPLIMSCLVTWHGSRSIRKGLSLWTFALFASLAFTIPMFLIANTLGPEFPSLAGSLIGLAIVLVALKSNLFRPSQPYLFPQDRQVERVTPKVSLTLFTTSLAPFLIVVGLLALSRIPLLPFQAWLQSLSLNIPSLLGTSVGHTISPFYNPLFFFILSGLLVSTRLRDKKEAVVEGITASAQRIVAPFIALFATLSFVNLLQYTAHNPHAFPSMLHAIVELLSFSQSAWLAVAPFIGLLGAFVTGSSTVSNLLFASVHYEIATAAQLSTPAVLTLQLAGGAFGNMIAIHNIVAVIAIANLHGKEEAILRYTFIPAVILTISAVIASITLSIW